MSLNLTRRLVLQEDASLIARPDVPRSKFVGSWTRKTTFDAGRLVPFLVDEVLPGDHLKYDVTAYVRMSTPLFPLFDNQRIDTFFFFVPNRLVWSNWRQFMGQQANPTDSIAFTVPVIQGLTLAAADATQGVCTIYDYMGLPVGNITGGQSINVNALPFRAYNLIYNEWFRDQNLVNSAVVSTADGPDVSIGHYAVRRRAKAHDYFTSALPWPQKFTAPNVTIGGEAPLRGIGFQGGAASIGPFAVDEPDGTAASYATAYRTSVHELFADASTPTPGVYADLAAATGMSVNDFRQAMLMQQLLEKDARGGTRYTEIIKNHFGVNSPDARLQRPEFMGGGSTPMQLTPIAQTAGVASPVGSLGAAGTAVGQHRASVAATEHGYVIGLINVRSELSYQQGLQKMWTRQTRYDFYWPSLAGLGEQAVLRQEIYCTGVDADDATVFGYQERWHEYRTRTSEVTGLFRSTVSGTLDAWHLSQRFTSAPVLGQTFIEDSPPMSRVLAGSVTTNQQYLADLLIKREAVRPIPMYGTPVQLGRF